jgi:hypothetical protein
MNAAAFAPSRRSTLWIPSTGPVHDPGRGHLFIILTDPGPDGMNLLVPVCTAGKKFDSTCILGSGDHPFLKQKSFVAYYLVNTYAAEVLMEQEQKGIIEFRGMLDEKVFALVCNGVETSRQTAPIHKRYFADATSRRLATVKK